MRRVTVMWRDATQQETLNADDLDTFGICTRHACGWLVRDTEDGLVLALDETTYASGTVEYSHAYYIPRNYILSISRW